MLKRKWMLFISCIVVLISISVYMVMFYQSDAEKGVPIVNQLQVESNSRVLETTLTLKEIDGVMVPFQNGIPVPSFEPQERLTLSLHGEWKKKRFDADHRFTMAARDQQWLERLKEEDIPAADFDDTHWEEKNLPFPENAIRGKEVAHSSATYENGVWYRRSFLLNGAWEGKAVTLHMLALNYVGDFWVNGHYVGYHEGGYTPFAFDITPYIRIGEPNRIVVRVDNPPWGSRTDIIPAQEGTDFFNYTGIIHDIYLEGTSPVHVVRADIVPLDLEGNLEVKVVIENRSLDDTKVLLKSIFYHADQKSEYFLSSPYPAKIKGNIARVETPFEQELRVSANTTKVVTFLTKVESPQIWSIWEPNLYVAEFTLSNRKEGTIDQYHTQFGVRTIATEGTQLLLNDQPVFLAGIARHEEWPDSGRTATWDKIRFDLEQIKSLHATLVRTGHYPNHVYTYLLLDRLGLVAMSEIPLWQFESEHFIAQEKRRLADQMWREMVFSQYNRPSVIMWSTQNESNGGEFRKQYNERLVQDLRANYNDRRLITQSSAADRPGAHDPSMEPLDVVGFTMYFGIFHGSTYYEGTKQFLEDVHKYWPNKPVMNTEFGHWTREDDTEASKQVETYTDTIAALLERATVSADGRIEPDGFLAGIDFWIMYNWYVNHNKWVDTFGIYHMDREQRKPVAELIQKDYQRITEKNRGFGNVD